MALRKIRKQIGFNFINELDHWFGSGIAGNVL
jgi:hypothetical protein